MSTSTTSSTMAPTAGIITLAELRTTIMADETLVSSSRTRLASAINAVAELVGQPMETIPAHPPLLRDLMAEIMPKTVGLSSGRLRNIRGDLQTAMTHAGVVKVPGRSLQALSPAWSELIKSLPEYGDRFKLSRFGRWCSAEGIEPEAVDDDVMTRFLVDIRDHSLVSGAVRTHRDAVIVWNRSARDRPEWPRRELAVPDNRNTYAIPWKRFPASLKADMDGWLDYLAGNNPLAENDFRPLQTRSLQLRKRQLHEFASALVIAGVEPTLLTSLADIVVPDRVAKGLAFFWERAGKKASVHVGQIAGTVCSIAKHWVKASNQDLGRLKAMKRKITPYATGMTPRNRSRLRPLKDSATQKELVGLPYIIADEVVAAGPPSRSLALQMETAIALALLFVTVIRIGNLVSLKIGQNLVLDKKGGVTLVLEEHEVKNRVAKETRLPTKTVQLLDQYIQDYRPLLGEAASPWLFPGRTAAAPKAVGPIRDRIRKCVGTRLGLDFHPHLTRHATALMTLQHSPGAYGMVQRLLGHKSINSAVTYYTGLETDAQMEYFHAEVLGLDNERAPLLADQRRRTNKARKKGRTAQA